jgi:putative flippase GtrA
MHINTEPDPTNPSTILRQALTFALVGLANTIWYFLVFNVLRLALPPYSANALAVSASITFSFWANRRFTFRLAGAKGVGRQFALYAGVFILTLVVSSGSLAILFASAAEVTRLAENVALIASSAILVSVRFVIVRRWVFSETTATLA